MSNASFNALQLLVLVPHRDIRRSLRVWSASLFSGGMSGAWSFPWVMPIAALNRPLSGQELKSRALMLRRETTLSGGKFTTGPSAIAALSEISVFGPAANFGLSDSFFAFEDAVIRRISPFVIGAALCQTGALPDVNCPVPYLSFRAAALANMSFSPLPSHNGTQNDFSFEWKIGKLYWLPRR